MWTAYNLFREKEFTDFGELRKALQEELGDIGQTAGKAVVATGGAAAAVAKKKAPAHDFDNSESKEDDEDDEDDEDEDFDDH